MYVWTKKANKSERKELKRLSEKDLMRREQDVERCQKELKQQKKNIRHQKAKNRMKDD